MTDRDNAIFWAREILARPDTWIIFDLETTGIKAAEIVQIGLLAPDGGVLLDSLVRPAWPIPAEAAAIHGITDADVQDAPTLAALLPAMAAAMHGKEVVIYNKGYDLGTLYGCLRRREWPDPDGFFAMDPDRFADDWVGAVRRWTCAMLPYSAFVGEWNDYRQSYKWQKLPGAGHTAIGDCRSTLAVIERMATAKMEREDG